MPPVPPTPSAPDPAYEQLKVQMARTPDLAARVKLAFDYFGVDEETFRRGLYTAYAPYQGFQKYTVGGFVSAVEDATSQYNTDHKLGWNFKPEDIFTLENSLLRHTMILVANPFGIERTIQDKIHAELKKLGLR
jgi:hypothetical protein